MLQIIFNCVILLILAGIIVRQHMNRLVSETMYELAARIVSDMKKHDVDIQRLESTVGYLRNATAKHGTNPLSECQASKQDTDISPA